MPFDEFLEYSPFVRCELFNKAYNHISERIDQVYKDLTKGKASPMGGVAYLSLEDSDVCSLQQNRIWDFSFICLGRNLMLLGSSITQCRQ